MKSLLLALSLLTVPLLANADVNIGFNQTPIGGAKGLYIDRPVGETYAAGISWLEGGMSVWETGLDTTLDYPGAPDIVLAENTNAQSDNLRLRADTAQMALGARIGHPVMPFQFEIDAGVQTAPLGGIFIDTYSSAFGIYMENRDPTLRRNTISMQNLFAFQTDTASNGTGDYQFWNFQAGAPVYTVQPDNSFCLTASKEGFFAAPPVAKPIVTGSWSDGTAAKSVLAALVKMGLVVDQTSP